LVLIIATKKPPKQAVKYTDNRYSQNTKIDKFASQKCIIIRHCILSNCAYLIRKKAKKYLENKSQINMNQSYLPLQTQTNEKVVSVGGLLLSEEILKQSFIMQKVDDPKITELEAQKNDEALIQAMKSFFELLN
jgi:hypothetical protein